ncbi:MAG: TRAP transporter small permease [Bacillota bacterium]
MRMFSGLVTEFSKVLDKLAGFCLVLLMALVVSNVVLRTVFKSPILGTYEYVSFLTAVVIGLALAYCAVQNGHIAIGLVADRLRCRTRAVVDTLVNAAALVFWGLTAWYIAGYAGAMTASGVVSPTTQTPFYPFVYLVAFGLLALCLVLLVRLAESVKKAAVK